MVTGVELETQISRSHSFLGTHLTKNEASVAKIAAPHALGGEKNRRLTYAFEG